MSEIILIALAAIFFSMWGFSIGNDTGAERACASVKMEWVNDKCMKVTREEVK
jgi:hypothetical protein